MKKFITMLAIGTLAAGSAFADKGERKEGDKPAGERPARAEGDKRPEGDRKRPEGAERARHAPGEMIKHLDTDESGDVSFEEFKAGPRAKDKPEEEVKKFFDKMDKDGDGKISQADLAAIRKEMEERRAANGGDKPKGPGADGGDRPKRPEGGKKKGGE